MRVTDAVTDRIRQRREKLERAGVLKPDLVGVPSHLHLWQASTDGGMSPLGEHRGVAGIDLIAIPTGKFLREGFETPQQMPWEDWMRQFAHLTELPDMPPPTLALIDAPENPIPAPTHNAEVVEMPEARGSGERLELDKEAVLIDLKKAREARKLKTRDEKFAELREQMDKEFEQNRLAQRDAEPQPARMLAFAPQWTPERHGR